MAKTPIAYDPEIILEFARRLYRHAATIMYTYPAIGFLLGTTLGVILINLIGTKQGPPPIFGGMIIGAIFCIIGFAIAKERAFKLKLQAQISLCQVQVEKNTQPPIN